NWVLQEQNDIDELLKGLKDDAEDEVKLRILAELNIKHNEEYCENRAILALDNAPSFFCPPWGSTFENSYLWLAGFRPSLLIQLLYTLSGAQIESHLEEFLQGIRKGDLGELSAEQLNLVNELQCKIIQEEEKLTTLMASLQEKIADRPLALLAYESDLHSSETGGDLDQAVHASALALSSVLVESDTLRVNTLKEMVKILTPLQGVDFLVATMKLHLSVHHWGKTRDHQYGRCNNNNT
ncbi:hypothetical protein AQUCO_02100199v1, partial [Aquilegia coerulea]